MVVIMDYVVLRKNKSILNLDDLYVHYNKSITFHIEHVVIGIDDNFSISADAELKEVESKYASYCVADFEDGASCFNLYFELDNGMVNYDKYLLKMYVGTLNETIVNEMQDKIIIEKAQKHCKLFFALLNPTFFLHMINQQENLEALMEDGAINIDFDAFVLEISIN